MTLSLHKSTAMADMQVANKQSRQLDVNGDANVELGSDTVQDTPESSFSQLLSLFNNDHKTASKLETKNLSGSGNSKINLDVEAISLDTADEPISVATKDDGELPVESSDDFLARLDQSSMLLQGNVVAEPVIAVQNDVNGNELPLQAGETNIASAALGGIKDISAIETAESSMASNGEVAFSDLTHGDHAKSDTVNGDELAQGMPVNVPTIGLEASMVGATAAVMPAMTDMSGNDVSLSEANLLNNVSLSKTDSLNAGSLTAKNGLLDSEPDKSNFSAMLADVTDGKSKFFGTAANVNGTASAVTENDSNSAAELQVATPADGIEQLDFAQIMESARKPEPLELATRTMAKSPLLTDVEQQVLEKRVHLNNNLASSELNEKIAIMAGKELHSATIRLDPAELGSMNIKLVMQHDQLHVTIQAQNPQSRDLLEQQMPRLREMLQQQGITLGETQVQADSSHQQQSAFQQSRQENGQKNSNNEVNYTIDSQTDIPMTTQYWQDSAKGVDFYA